MKDRSSESMEMFTFTPKMEVINDQNTFTQGRKYRSRKVRPCDACRKRRIGCIRDAGTVVCTTCRVRGISCTYESAPIKRITNSKEKSDKMKDTDVPKMNECSSPSNDSMSNIQNHEMSESSSHERLLITSVLKETSSHEKSESLDTGSPSSGSSNAASSSSSFSSDTTALENHKGLTSVFVGFSGDRDPWLLRKVQLETEANNYRAPSNADPIYFSFCPTEHLDSIPERYNSDVVNSVVQPYVKTLIDIYFRNVNPSLPIISKRIFKNERTCSTLLSAVYTKAIQHWNKTSKEEQLAKPHYLLRDFAVRALTLEFGSATLQTVQASLIHLQFDPIIIRDANCPHSWVFTSSLVAICQQLGLHLDPSTWDIPLWEKRLRRRLWWAAFVQDKWECFGLSRPSHISDDNYSVGFIKEDDFIEEEEDFELSPEDEYTQGVKLFISMIHLTKVLSLLLKAFYSVHKVLGAKRTLDEVMSLGLQLIYQAESIETLYFPKKRVDNNLLGSFMSLKLAKVTLVMSCYKQILCTDPKAAFESINAQAYKTCKEFVDELSQVGLSHLTTNWWSYSRMNFSVVGVAILAFYVSSEDDYNKSLWRQVSQNYQQCLTCISKLSLVSQLALLRFESLFTRIDKVLNKVVNESHNYQQSNDFQDNDNVTLNFQELNKITEDDNFLMDWLRSNE